MKMKNNIIRINKCILRRLPVFIIFVMIFGEAYGVTIIGNLYRIILGVLGCLISLELVWQD